MRPLNVLVADDHPIVRKGIRSLLESEPDIIVVGEAADGVAVIQAITELEPDVVIMDLSMPGIGGEEATTRIRIEKPNVRVVALTAHEEPGYVRRLLSAGVTGYILKRTAADSIVRAVRCAASGQKFIDPAVTQLLIQDVIETTSEEKKDGHLSDRETEVLRFLAEGFSNKQIAARLAVSVKTVETYKSRAMEKLGLLSRVDIVRYALRQGWLKYQDT